MIVYPAGDADAQTAANSLKTLLADKGIKAGHGVAATGVVNTVDYQRAIDTVTREAQFKEVYRIILEKVEKAINER